MGKFRKKPVVIDAWPTKVISNTAKNDWHSLPSCIQEAYEKGGWVFMNDGEIYIPTLEGIMIAEPDDYIIRGVKGEFYPCKPDIFEATYEKIEFPYEIKP